MQRWVLDLLVLAKLLDGSGFTRVQTDVIRDPGDDNTPPMTTFLICAQKPELTA